MKRVALLLLALCITASTAFAETTTLLSGTRDESIRPVSKFDDDAPYDGTDGEDAPTTPKVGGNIAEKPTTQGGSSTLSSWRIAQLDGEGRAIYQSFVSGIAAKQSVVTAKYKDLDKALASFSTILELIKTNHPEFFWVSYDSQSSEAKNGTITWAITFYPKYVSGGKLLVDEINRVQASIDQVAAGIKKGNNRYETVQNINNWLCQNVTYSFQYSNYDMYEINGALVSKRAACEGFAKTFQYLCDRLSVPSITVPGKGILSGATYDHAWNIAQMEDGVYYFVDTTWSNLTRTPTNYLLLGSNSVVGGYKVSTTHKPYATGYPALATERYGG